MRGVGGIAFRGGGGEGTQQVRRATFGVGTYSRASGNCSEVRRSGVRPTEGGRKARGLTQAERVYEPATLLPPSEESGSTQLVVVDETIVVVERGLDSRTTVYEPVFEEVGASGGCGGGCRVADGAREANPSPRFV